MRNIPEFKEVQRFAETVKSFEAAVSFDYFWIGRVYLSYSDLEKWSIYYEGITGFGASFETAVSDWERRKQQRDASIDEVSEWIENWS